MKWQNLDKNVIFLGKYQNMFLFYLLFPEDNGKRYLSLYHLNLLHLKMDILLFAFDFLKERRDKLDHFVPLMHVKTEKGFVTNCQDSSPLNT